MPDQWPGIGERGPEKPLALTALHRPLSPTIILGIDPGLQRTGFGIIKQSGNTLSFVASGVIKSDSSDSLAIRLCALSKGIEEVIIRYTPNESAIEETFVSVNGASTLKLGQARGAILLTLAQASLPIAEYAATLVKKSIVGAGRAEKHQVAQMVRMLLPGCAEYGADAMDALAVAITHAHHRRSGQWLVASNSVVE